MRRLFSIIAVLAASVLLIAVAVVPHAQTTSAPEERPPLTAYCGYGLKVLAGPGLPSRLRASGTCPPEYVPQLPIPMVGG